MEIKEFLDECKKGGIDRAKDLLRTYVSDDQPDDFCNGWTSRALCREASNAITGEKCIFYIDSKHGSDLYFHMWGCGS